MAEEQTILRCPTVKKVLESPLRRPKKINLQTQRALGGYKTKTNDSLPSGAGGFSTDNAV